MRHLATSLLAATVLVLAGCATRTASEPGVCDLSSVPSAAVFGVRYGVDTATYPATMPRDGNGCQRVWYGERAHPERMQVLATYYYEGGHVRRLVGRVPGGASYDCQYRDGTLDNARSQNPGQCPKASELQ